jgi:hypothetical protein
MDNEKKAFFLFTTPDEILTKALIEEKLKFIEELENYDDKKRAIK